MEPECLTLSALQTLLLSGPGGQADDADAMHVNKRARLDSNTGDLGNEDGAMVQDEEEDEVPTPFFYECCCKKLIMRQSISVYHSRRL